MLQFKGALKMTMAQNLIKVSEYRGAGYRPLVDYDAWRVAIINGEDCVTPSPVTIMQKHEATDEVFVLLRGECILVAADGPEVPADFMALRLEPLRVYNVKKGVWHACVRYPDTTVLVVENRDTAKSNSLEVELTKDQITLVGRLMKNLA
jgi:ureidoglycolate hydrolase